MKSLTSLSTVALALIVGMAGATAQTRAKRNAPASPEARVKMCNDMYKGQYRTQHEGFVFQHGYCLSNAAGWAGAGPPVAGGGGQWYAPR
jgi:hypothetical protein